MKQVFRKLSAVIGVLALSVIFSALSHAQDADDGLDEFMNESAESAPAEEANIAKPVDAKPKAAKPIGKKGDQTPPAAATEVIDMRLANPPPQAVNAQPNPALDKIEALMIAEAEMKVFMKSGGLQSRKIK